MKSVMDSMPIKRGLATIGGAEVKSQDPLVKALYEAKNNFN
jgi:hypothetical protein